MVTEIGRCAFLASPGSMRVTLAVSPFIAAKFITHNIDSDDAILEVNGNKVARFDLNSVENKTSTFNTDAGPITLEWGHGGIAVVKASCRDRICMHMGRISRAGEQIICVPGKCVIYIPVKKENGIDAVAE